MTTFYFSKLADGASVNIRAGFDRLSFASSIDAADVDVSWTEDGRGLVLSAAGKTVTITGVTPFYFPWDTLAFANGSRLSAPTAFDPVPVATAKADLLIGSTAAQPTTLVSVTNSGTVPVGSSSPHDASADGRYVLFRSSSSADLTDGAQANFIDWYVRDTVAGTTIPVILQSNGNPVLTSGVPTGPKDYQISADGRYVVFSSISNEFISETARRDLETGEITPIVVRGQDGQIISTLRPTDFSADGRYALFNGNSAILPADDNDVTDVYRYDFATGQTKLITDEGFSTDGSSTNALFAENGDRVVFNSLGVSFFDNNGLTDVYLIDNSIGFPSLVSMNTSGSAANGPSFVLAVSADGNRILFRSSATDIVSTPLTGSSHIYLRDVSAGTTMLVDSDPTGLISSSGTSVAVMSKDGRFVVFLASTANLVSPGGTDAAVYVKDTLSGSLAIVSYLPNGQLATELSSPVISDDGSHIMFRTVSNLDPALPGNGFPQIYKVANPLLQTVLAGGVGDDTYVIQNANDAVLENAGEGIDTIRSSVSYILADNVENLLLTGDGDISATGNGLDNVLGSNTGNNVIDGGLGIDTVSYDSAAAGVTVALDLPGFAQDTVGAGIDTLTGIENVIGSAFDDFILGDDGANRVDGGAGADTMIGGAGDDTYIVDSLLDVVYEDAAGGTDTIETFISYTLAAEVENLVLLGTANLNATGNSLANVLTGNSGSNRLDGVGGSDTASYAHATTGVIVALDRSGPQSTGAGIDTLISIENLRGSNYNDILFGNSGTNTLDGGSGIDTANYSRASAAVTVTLATSSSQATGGAGTDRLISIENLVGSIYNDTLTGSSGTNVLDGGLGQDTMSGGSGNDTYIVDNELDVVIEAASSGSDVVQSSVSYTLSANVENLILTGTADINGTGNSSSNVISGNAGNNILNGGSGADTVNYNTVTGDITVNLTTGIALGAAGTDTLISIENVLGGAGNDTIVGNSGANILRGGAGSDTLTGLGGNDIFALDARTGVDTITDFVSGSDKVRLSMATFKIGNGDSVVDSASVISGPGGYDASAEVLVVTGAAASLSLADVSSQVGLPTSGSVVIGQSTLLVVTDGNDTGIFRFAQIDPNLVISPGELTLLAILDNVSATAATDYIFTA